MMRVLKKHQRPDGGRANDADENNAKNLSNLFFPFPVGIV